MTQQPRESGQERFSKEEWKARKDAERKELFDLMDRTTERIAGDPEALESYLSLAGRMDRYSAANALLIYAACPDATRLRGRAEWEKEGAAVKDEAAFVRILEPVTYQRRDGTEGRSFAVRRLYDRASVSGAGENPREAVDERAETLTAAMLDSSRCQISQGDELPAADLVVLYDHPARALRFGQGRADGETLFRCVARERAHEQFAEGRDTYLREERAFDAACAAYLLCCRWGVPAEGYRLLPPPSWEHLTPKEIRGELSEIRAAEREISLGIRMQLKEKAKEKETGEPETQRGDER